MGKEQNYFIINNYSGYWEDPNVKNGQLIAYTYNNNERYLSLQPHSSYKLKKIIDLELNDQKNRYRDYSNRGITEDPAKICSFDFDGTNFLYILFKESKIIRRINLSPFLIDRYQYGGPYDNIGHYSDENITTNNIKLDENLINCNFMKEPQVLCVGIHRVYVSDDTKIHVISKSLGHQLLRSIQFNKTIKFFALTDDEKLLFFVLENDKNRVYLENLTLENNDQINNANTMSKKSSLIIELENNNEGFENSAEIVDIGIFNRLKLIVLLTPTLIILYDYEGKFISRIELQNLDTNSIDLKRVCLTIDENKNTLFVGNQINDRIALASQIKFQLRENSHPIKAVNSISKYTDLPFSIDITYENLEYKGRIEKVFKSKCYSKSSQKDFLVILSLIPKSRSLYENQTCNGDDGYPFDDKDYDRYNKNRKNDKEEEQNSYKTRIAILDRINAFIPNEKVEWRTKFLDTLLEKTRWNKIRVYGDTPKNSTVKIYFFCNDIKREPNKDEWISAPQNTNVISLLDCEGRFLKIKLELSTLDGNNSPRVEKLRVEFLPSSFLKYLPSIFQENEQSKIFLERFLAIYQIFFEESDSIVTDFTKILDPAATPKGYLPWLASWLAIGETYNWDIEGKRRFLSHASSIFEKRGTKEGLEKILSVYFNITDHQGQKPHSDDRNKTKVFDKESYRKRKKFFHIVEDNQLEKYLWNKNKTNKRYAKYGIHSATNNLHTPYHFYVLINPFFVNEDEIKQIKKIIELEKPAHTVAVISKMPSLFTLGNNSFLGVNSILQNRGKLRLGISQIGFNSILGSLEKEGKLGLKGRLGIDTLLG